jgi:hypothetical protein
MITSLDDHLSALKSAALRIDMHRRMPEYAEDDRDRYLGPAWATLGGRDRRAILQFPCLT